MNTQKLAFDPFNLLISGVGGQGNLLASKLIGLVLINKGFSVTIGESLGGTQRGGSVSSHIRISQSPGCAPLMPLNSAHMVIGLEATETIRLLQTYGNDDVSIVCNTWPIPPVSVLSGEAKYPKTEEIEGWIKALSARCWCLNATNEALKLGSPIYANIIMIGALVGSGMLPLELSDFEEVVSVTLSNDKVEKNIRALEIGRDAVTRSPVEAEVMQG